MKKLTVSYENKPCYDICLEHNFEKLPNAITSLYPDCKSRKICIITDSNVDPLYGKSVIEHLSGICSEVGYFVQPAGEEHKNLSSIGEMYRYLIEHKFTRKDILVALGGGVIGDMTGFAAATYLRGIDFIQVPTTLLSMVDSSIGGKTGVDFENYKNMVGAFHMPRLVYTNISVLSTLSKRQYASGFAEIMKHGLIKDLEYYQWLIENSYEIDDQDSEVVEEMIYRSMCIKKAVVENDPKEQGERALLNLGHTIGHGIEKACNFSMTHGECVALGCVAAAYISHLHGLLEKDEYLEIRDMFVPFNLPITMADISFSPEDVLKNTKSDKKNAAGSLKFILLKKIGQAVIDTTVTDEDIIKAVKELIYEA